MGNATHHPIWGSAIGGAVSLSISARGPCKNFAVISCDDYFLKASKNNMFLLNYTLYSSHCDPWIRKMRPPWGAVEGGSLFCLCFWLICWIIVLVCVNFGCFFPVDWAPGRLNYTFGLLRLVEVFFLWLWPCTWHGFRDPNSIESMLTAPSLQYSMDCHVQFWICKGLSCNKVGQSVPSLVWLNGSKSRKAVLKTLWQTSSSRSM